jgi:hypothetical protein
MERLFIHPENQTVLWNLIQRSAYWNEFSRVLKQPPEEWFRRCIETQYRRICSSANTPELSKKEWLLSKNKETIRMMTDEILSVIRPTNTGATNTGVVVGQSSLSTGMNVGIDHRNNMDPRNSIYARTSVDPRVDMSKPPTMDKMYSTIEESPTLVYSSSRNYDIPPISAFDMEQERKAKYEKAKLEFEQYQSQYNRLLQPLTPPAPDFSESAPQSKIANMEELLIIQQKMRETDYDMFSPPPPPDRDNIRKEVVEVIDKNIDHKPIDHKINEHKDNIDKKSVSWSPALFTP